MVVYQFNLAREKVVPIEVRKRLRRWIVVYYAVAGLCLFLVIYALVRDALAVDSARASLAHEEKLFVQARPGAASAGAYMRGLAREMAGLASELDAVKRFQNLERNDAAVLLGLAEPLPAGMELGRVELDGAGGQLRFDVYGPMEQKIEDAMAPPHLISLWEKHPLLAGRVSQVASENSERVRVGGREMMCWHFTGTLLGLRN